MVFTVGTSWTGSLNYAAEANTVTIYGDITWFECSDNQTKITAIDVSKNTALKWLSCYGNNFTKQAFNDLMCSLPLRTSNDLATFYPLYDDSDANSSVFMTTNSQIAQDKNWRVHYDFDGGGTPIPATSGTYVCPVEVNMNSYITLTVQQGQQIQLDLKAAAANTPVKIKSGATDVVVNVGTSWIGYQNYTAGATTMTIYGDITHFDCDGNETKLTALDVSKNTALTSLYCKNNQLTALDVSKNTALKWLSCYGNNFTTQAFNNIMCSLPIHTSNDLAAFYPLYNASDANASAFMAANSQIAKDKNWQVIYNESNEEEIPATSGTYVCPTTTGIDEVASVALALYPNPVKDYVTIATEEVGKAITITDLAGRTVMTATATDSETTLNVSHLPNGTYIVRIGNRVAKIVKN